MIKRRVQKVEITLLDNRVGEFFGEELVKPQELDLISKSKIGVRMYEAVEIELGKEKRNAIAEKR